MSKNINPSLVLVQPRKTRPLITERLLMGRKESNQTNNQINIHSSLCKTTTLKKTKNLFSKTNYRLMQVKSIAECSLWSILQYFRPSLSYHLSLRSLFCIFLSGRFLHRFYYADNTLERRLNHRVQIILVM